MTAHHYYHSSAYLLRTLCTGTGLLRCAPQRQQQAPALAGVERHDLSRAKARRKEKKKEVTATARHQEGPLRPLLPLPSLQQHPTFSSSPSKTSSARGAAAACRCAWPSRPPWRWRPLPRQQGREEAREDKTPRSPLHAGGAGDEVERYVNALTD